jgi:hypothetical protein
MRLTSTTVRASAIVGETGGVDEEAERPELADPVDDATDGCVIADVARDTFRRRQIRDLEVDRKEMIHGALQSLKACAAHPTRCTGNHANRHENTVLLLRFARTQPALLRRHVDMALSGKAHQHRFGFLVSCVRALVRSTDSSWTSTTNRVFDAQTTGHRRPVMELV